MWIIYERTSGDGRRYVGGSVVGSGAALRGHAEHCESHRRQDLDPCAKFRSVSTTAKIDRVLLTAVILLKC